MLLQNSKNRAYNLPDFYLFLWLIYDKMNIGYGDII